MSFTPCLNHSPLTGLYGLVIWLALSKFMQFITCLVCLACDFPLPVTPKAYLDLITSSLLHETFFFPTPSTFTLQEVYLCCRSLRSSRHALFIASFSISCLVHTNLTSYPRCKPGSRVLPERVLKLPGPLRFSCSWRKEDSAGQKKIDVFLADLKWIDPINRILMFGVPQTRLR